VREEERDKQREREIGIEREREKVTGRVHYIVQHRLSTFLLRILMSTVKRGKLKLTRKLRSLLFHPEPQGEEL
jgi:hypothetical protein